MLKTSIMVTVGVLVLSVHTTALAHLTEVACVDVPAGETRPEFGCFNVGTVTGLQFSQPTVYWHLRTFGSRKAADAAKSATGLVVEEDGRVWLSEFGPRNSTPRRGEAIAVIGPLQLPSAKSYSAVLSYAVMRPGDSSRVHTHAGPEGWYVLAGEQCLETPAGASRARAGGIMTVPPNIPMELNVTGTALRRAFALVIHDSTQERGTPSAWKPSGACSR
jgi:quercetin dioxygenase-like cupin family protein